MFGSLEICLQRELWVSPALLHSLTMYFCRDVPHGPKATGPPVMTDASEDVHSLYKLIAPNICYSNSRVIDTGSK